MIRRIRLALKMGLLVGIGLSSFVGVISALGFADLEADYGLSIIEVVGLYLTGTISGGLIVGVIWPLAKWRLGAAIVGAVATMPFYITIGLAMSGTHPDLTIVDSIILGVLIGGLGGALLWSRDGRWRIAIGLADSDDDRR